MIKGVKYSKRLSVASAACVGAACAMALLHQHVASKRFEHTRRAADLAGALSKQIASKSDFEDSNLNALRARVNRFRGQLGPEDAWERLVRQFGEGWTAEVGPRVSKGGYSFQNGSFVLPSPMASDWPRIVEAIKAAEHLPGVGIAKIEMKTSGKLEPRSIDIVRIVVAIHSRRIDSIP